MGLNQRAVIGALAMVLVVSLLAAQFVPPIFVVLVLVLLGLGAMVVFSRRAEAQRARDEETWEAAGEWGLPGEVEDEELVDLEGRLQDVGLTDRTSYLEPGAEVLEEYVVYETIEGQLEDLPAGAEVVEEYVVYETIEEQPEDLLADAEMFEEYLVEEISDEPVVLEELLELEDPVGAAVAADRFVDESRIQDDDAILAAAQASAVQYDEVLSRDDANAETREILSRVASLLAKYE